MGILKGWSRPLRDCAVAGLQTGEAACRGIGRPVAWLAASLALLAGCGEAPAPPLRPPTEVTTVTVATQDTPVTFEFVAQTQSSREVEIRARVEGFLEKRLYNEGDLVQAGQVLFQMDPRPFEAALQSARGQLAQQQARLEMARSDLARIRPLVKIGAISKKSLDDAIGNERQAQAAVLSAEGEVRTAQLNLGYTTIASPLTGVSSFAKLQEGSYVTPGAAGLLTYVSQVDPIYINFSLSENEMLKFRSEIAAGQLRFPRTRTSRSRWYWPTAPWCPIAAASTSPTSPSARQPAPS
ncbi:efflux RND transporter periplasmic adaptor subunit [Azotobacter sp. CWF10]